MEEKFTSVVKKFINHYKLKNISEVLIFMSLILIFSILGYLWKHFFDYTIFGVHVLDPGYIFLTKYVLLSSYWILANVFSVPLTYVVESSRLYFTTSSYLYIYHGCSGLKEMAMFLFIMLLFPGSYKMKLWFIPASLVTIYLIVILRIVFLSLIYLHIPDWFNFFHNYIFNLIFFFLFFLLWLLWIKYFYKKSTDKPGRSESS